MAEKSSVESSNSKEEILTLDPSYSRLLEVHYWMICNERYKQTNKIKRDYFKHNLTAISETQKALDYMRVRRVFVTNPVLRKMAPEEWIRLTPKEQSRLDKLLKQ